MVTVESHVRVQLRDCEELGHLSSASAICIPMTTDGIGAPGGGVGRRVGGRWLGCHLKSIALLKPVLYGEPLFPAIANSSISGRKHYS